MEVNDVLRIVSDRECKNYPCDDCVLTKICSGVDAACRVVAGGKVHFELVSEAKED